MPTLPKVSPSVELRYAQVETLLGGLLDIHPDRKSALTARLRLFRLRDFPPGLKAQKTARFTYNLDALIQLALAMELLDGMVPQEAVPPLIQQNWPDVRAAFGRAFALISESGDEDAACSAQRPMLLLRPQALAGFRQARDQRSEATVSASLVTPEDLERFWRDPGSPLHAHFGPVSVVDLQALAKWLRDALLIARWAVPASFDDYGAAK